MYNFNCLICVFISFAREYHNGHMLALLFNKTRYMNYFSISLFSRLQQAKRFSVLWKIAVGTVITSLVLLVLFQAEKKKKQLRGVFSFLVWLIVSLFSFLDCSFICLLFSLLLFFMRKRNNSTVGLFLVCHCLVHSFSH
jgi:hypothetical protein